MVAALSMVLIGVTRIISRTCIHAHMNCNELQGQNAVPSS